MKKALLIISQEMFRDEEYAEPKEVLQKGGASVTTASLKEGIARGKLGMVAHVDFALEKVNASDFDAILFVGGPGAHVYYDNPVAHKIAQDAFKQDKVLGAICGAPPILANAGVLKGKKATMFADTGELQSQGAIYTGAEVEVDGKVITATGPQTAREWGNAILKMLNNG